MDPLISEIAVDRPDEAETWRATFYRPGASRGANLHNTFRTSSNIVGRQYCWQRPSCFHGVVKKDVQRMKTISIVSPCYNEEDSIADCVDAVQKLFRDKLAEYQLEHIFCDN